MFSYTVRIRQPFSKFKYFRYEGIHQLNNHVSVQGPRFHLNLNHTSTDGLRVQHNLPEIALGPMTYTIQGFLAG
jgi:hypothetical protein